MWTNYKEGNILTLKKKVEVVFVDNDNVNCRELGNRNPKRHHYMN